MVRSSNPDVIAYPATQRNASTNNASSGQEDAEPSGSTETRSRLRVERFGDGMAVESKAAAVRHPDYSVEEGDSFGTMDLRTSLGGLW